MPTPTFLRRFAAQCRVTLLTILLPASLGMVTGALECFRSCSFWVKRRGMFLLNLLSWGCISSDVFMLRKNIHAFVLKKLRSPNLSIVSKLYFKGMMHSVVTTYRPSSDALGFLDMTDISNLIFWSKDNWQQSKLAKARHLGGFHSSGQLTVEEGNRCTFPFDLFDDSAMLWNFSNFQVDQGEMSPPLLRGEKKRPSVKRFVLCQIVVLVFF